MAKDDYDVIVYKILVYFYGCMKREIMYQEGVFNKTVRKDVKSDEYFYDILFMMQEEGLIKGLTFTSAWGGVNILTSEIYEAKITPEGIHYLKDNSKMKKTGEFLRESADLIARLAEIVL